MKAYDSPDPAFGAGARPPGASGDTVTLLRESEERYRATFEEAAVGIAHLGLDGRWLQINPRLAEIVGYSREELLQKSFQQITHPEDLDPDLPNMRRLLAGELRSFSKEKRYLRRDGSPVWVKVTVSLSRSRTGEPKFFISFVEDISDRKESEAALRQAHGELEARVQERTAEIARSNLLLCAEVEERKRTEELLGKRTREIEEANQFLDSIIENLPAMLFVKEASQLRFVRGNKGFEEILGFSPQSMIGKNDYDFFPANEADFFTQVDREVLARGEMVEIPEEAIKTASGEIRYLHTRKIPVLGSDGKPRYLVGISEDITEARQAREEKERLIAELRAALAEVRTLSHLLPICGWCKKVRDDKGYWNSVEGYFNKASGVRFTHGMCPECAQRFDADSAPSGEPTATRPAAS